MTKPTLQAVDPDAPLSPAPDPFDLASLRLNPSFQTTGVKKLLTTVPARRHKTSSALTPRRSIARTLR
jgi:hypothetical protein